jgi:hypothetical protein
LLPDGGALRTANLSPITLALRRAVDFARTVTLVKRTELARKLWHSVYPSLTADRAGVFGGVTNRAEAQTMRLALIYSLLDCRAEIDVPHLQAALAVWQFSERCARWIFGEKLGDRTADRILDELRSAGQRGLTKNDLREFFQGHIGAGRLDEALGFLFRLKLATWTKESPKGGRPAIVWRAIRPAVTPETVLPAQGQTADQVQPEPEMVGPILSRSNQLPAAEPQPEPTVEPAPLPIPKGLNEEVA